MVASVLVYTYVSIYVRIKAYIYVAEGVSEPSRDIPRRDESTRDSLLRAAVDSVADDSSRRQDRRAWVECRFSYPPDLHTPISLSIRVYIYIQ